MRCFENLSRAVLHVDEVLPHNPISSLQAKITGCLVSASKFNSSALPPLSPFKAFESSKSSPETIDDILSAEISRRPPDKWSTSSNKINVRGGLVPGVMKSEPCVDA